MTSIVQQMQARRVLPDLSQGQDMVAEIARLRAENASLKAKDKGVSLRISEKGGLSMYGLGRFPITLYKSQWLKLIQNIEQVKEFIAEAGDSLSSKD